MRIHRPGRPPCIEAALLLLAVSLPSAGAQLLGPEFLVNTYTTGRQAAPAVAATGSSGFVVVWESSFQDGSLYGVFGQRINSAGAKVGSEFQVNTYTTSSQIKPVAAAAGTDNFVVVWESYLQDGSSRGVFGQRFNSAGTALGSEFQINSYTTGRQAYPAVAATGAGNFVVVWESYLQDGSSAGVFGQRFNSSGAALGSEFRVNTYTTSVQMRPAVASDGSGNFVVVWASNGPDGASLGVVGQRFSSTGTPLGSEFQVNTYTTGSQYSPEVAADGSGNFVVVWQSSLQDGSNYGVFGQRFSSVGSHLGSEFQVNSYTTDLQRSPALAMDGSGNFAVVWDSRFQDGSNFGVFGQQFDASGSPWGSELQVNTTTASEQFGPAAAADGSGSFVVVWRGMQDGSGYGVFGQRLRISLFLHDFEAFPPFWSDTTATMCAGFCAGQSPDGCFCDNLCLTFGDCCIDACTTCGTC